MNEKQTIIDCATQLKLHYVKVDLDETICQAQIDKPTYMSFLAQVLRNEVNGRMEREQKRRLALAHLPSQHDLDNFDFNYSSGISRQEMKELRELNWLDQAYNIILMGPSGTGKTFIRRTRIRSRHERQESLHDDHGGARHHHQDEIHLANCYGQL